MNDQEQQDLIDEVNAIHVLEDAAVAVINGLADKLEQAVADATGFKDLKLAVEAQVAALRDNAAPLAAAVAAQTPAAPPTPVLTLGGATDVAVGGTSQLTASASDGSVVGAFVSSDTSVATVDSSGLVTGVAAGAAAILASTPTCTATITVTVA